MMSRTATATQIQQRRRPGSSSSSLHSLDHQNADLKRINSFMDRAYGLVWKEQDYDEAVAVLKEALTLQESIRGKYHRETGMTYSFIGTALWMSGDCEAALMYFCEARRIFHRITSIKAAAAAKGGSPPPPQPKAVGQIKERITKILEELGLDSAAIASYHETLDQAVEHEQQRYVYQETGEREKARLEFQKARACSERLRRVSMEYTATN